MMIRERTAKKPSKPKAKKLRRKKAAPKQRFDPDKFLSLLWSLDDELVRHGFPPISPWWRRELERYFRSGRRTFVLRVGRRGGKSSTFCRVGVAWALYGTYDVPPGDTGVVAFISVRREDSSDRLRTIRAILDALGIGYGPAGEYAIELLDRPVVFKTYAASVAGVSGFTAIAALGDEVCKWLDRNTGANPATEVIASLKPTLATQPHAPLFLCSSPLSTLDAHYKLFEKGESSQQLVAEASTWEANPTITEQQTREDENDPRIWAREYAAIPQPAVNAAFDVDAITRAFEPRIPPLSKGRRTIVLDPSSGRADTWAWGVCGWDEIDGQRILVFDLVDGKRGRFFQQVLASTIVEQVAGIAKAIGAEFVHADQREDFALRSLFQQQGLGYSVHDWTGQTKPAAVERLRRWFAEGRIWLCKNETLKRELLAFEEKITPSGQFTFGARGFHHDDYVALLITAAMAIGDDGDSRLVDWPALGRMNDSAEAWSRWGDVGERGGRGF